MGGQEVADAILAQLEAGTLDVNDVVNAYVNNVYQTDFATVNRRTFQCDDVIHIVESPVANLSIEEIKEKERLFLDTVASDGRQNASYYKDRQLKSFYRHIRLWSLYSQGRIPSKYGDNQGFHLFQAYASLHRHVTNEDPPQQPKGLESLIDLITQASS